MTHFTALPRNELVRLVRKLATERNQARQAADYWRDLAIARTPTDVTPERTRRDALALLQQLGADPESTNHRRDLMTALDEAKQPQPLNLVKTRKPGPRCAKGLKPCLKPLDPDGLCPRHDHRARRAIREGAAA